MTTTPEQLQAWRVKFESFYSDERECLLTRDANSGEYVNEAIDSAWMGYLRAKQETEQAIKDVRKQALEDVAEGFIKQKSWTRDYAYAVVQHAAEEGATK